MIRFKWKDRNSEFLHNGWVRWKEILFFFFLAKSRGPLKIKTLLKYFIDQATEQGKVKIDQEGNAAAIKKKAPHVQLSDSL